MILYAEMRCRPTNSLLARQSSDSRGQFRASPGVKADADVESLELARWRSAASVIELTNECRWLADVGNTI